jgi:hypothetical protein
MTQSHTRYTLRFCRSKTLLKLIVNLTWSRPLALQSMTEAT